MTLSPRLVVGLVLGITFVAWRAWLGPNLARGKPVVVSSVLFGDPGAVVNGWVEWGAYAVHTRNDAPAWMWIDLEAPARVAAVHISGRGDGFFADGTPLRVEVSADGTTFTRVGACRGRITQIVPCRIEVGGLEARYVRFVHRTHIALSEVEVFGIR